MNELNDPSRWFLEARLKFRHLRLFVALGIHENMARAAESIGLSQPAASKLLAEVEKSLGARLFSRLPRGLQANELGNVFIRRSRAILSELSKAGTEFNALRSGDVGAANVGTISSVGLELIANAINVTQQDNSSIQVWVDVGTTEHLLKQVAEGMLDFAIGWETPEIDRTVFSFSALMNETFTFFCRAGHPLLKKQNIRLADLVDAQWVLPSPGTSARHVTESLFLANGLQPPSRVINTTTFMSFLVFMRVADAVTVSSSGLTNLFSSLGEFQAIPIGEPFGAETLGVFTLNGIELKPSARRLLDEVKRAANELNGKKADFLMHADSPCADILGDRRLRSARHP
jgi:DNA-binding transcriptional LysR family regulator